MKYFVCLSALLVLIGSPVRLETSAASDRRCSDRLLRPPRIPSRQMVQTYCVTCHSTRARMGGLALEGLNPQAAAANAEVWEKALRKLRGNLMPPPGSPQPPQKDVAVLRRLDGERARHQRQGSEGRLCADPASEPHRVRRVGEGAGGRGREPEGRSAAGHPGGGLRQHRGRLERIAGVPRTVRDRGTAGRADRGGQSQSSRVQREVPDRRQPESGRPSASGYVGRHEVQAQLPGRRRVSDHPDEPGGGPVQQCAGAREHGGHH